MREFTVPLARRIRELANPTKIRRKSHDFKALSKRHEVTQSLLKNELGYVLRAVSPKHSYFKNKEVEDDWLHERTKTMVNAIFLEGSKKREKLEGAVNEHLDRLERKSFSKKRIERIKTLINSLSSHISHQNNSELTRYGLLEKVMEKHGFDYNSMKDDLYAISYNMLVKPADIYFPKDEEHRKKDIEYARKAIKNNKLKGKAKRVAEWFVSHTPATDLERLRQLHPTENLEVLSYQENWANAMTKLQKLHEEDGMNPVQAYAQAWKKAGYKEHYELPRNEYWVYRLHEFAENTKNMEKDELASELGMGRKNPAEILQELDSRFQITPEMTPKQLMKRIDKTNLATWKANYAFARSKVHSQLADMSKGKKMLQHLKVSGKYLEAGTIHIESDGIVAFSAGKQPKGRISLLKS